MKRAMLWLSLTLNVVLLALAGWQVNGSHAKLPPREARLSTAGTNQTPGRAAHHSKPVKESSPASPWGRIESPDLEQFVANLRGLGCPEMTIQDLVAIRLARSCRAELLAALGERERTRPYWQRKSPQAHAEDGMLARRARAELQDRMDDVLGVSHKQILARLMMWPESLFAPDYLPTDKARQLRDLGYEYQARRQEASPNLGMPDMESKDQRARLMEVSRQHEADLRNLLTPAEYEAYLVRESPYADYVKQRLPEAASAEEFARMVKLAAAAGLDQTLEPIGIHFGAEWPGAEEPAVAEWKQREAEFRDRLKAELGEERLAEQARAEEARKQAEQEERDRLEAPRREAEERREITKAFAGVEATEEQAIQFQQRLKELKPQFEEREQALKQAGGSDEEKKAMEAAVKVEFERKLAEVIGAEKARRLMQQLEAGEKPAEPQSQP